MPEATDVAPEVQETGVAPVEPEVTEPTAPEPIEPPKGPLTRREARRQAIQQASEKKAAAPESEPETIDTETSDPEGQTDETEAAAASPETPETPEEQEVTPEPAAPQTVEIQIPEGHPLREGGLTGLTVPVEQERMVRGLVNGYTRRQDVAAREQTIIELENKLARIEAAQEAQKKWEASPEYKAALDRYQKMRGLEEDGSLDPGSAMDYWRGAQKGLDELTEKEYNERIKTAEGRRADRAAHEWRNEAWQNQAQALPEVVRNLPQYSQWFTEALESFDTEFALGHLPNVKTPDDLHREFTKFFQSRIIREKAARAALQGVERDKTAKDKDAAARAAAQEREREKLKQEAVEEYKRGLAEKRREVPPHPIANLAAQRSVPATTDEPAGDIPPVETAHDARKRLKREARQHLRKHLGP